MSQTGQKVVEKIQSLPEADRQAAEESAVEFLDLITDLKSKIAEGEADIAAGRTKPFREVMERLLSEYASP